MEDPKSLLQYVRDYLKFSLTEEGTEPTLPAPSDFLDEKRAVFVTLRKGGRLRGCCGQIVANKPLRENLKRAALSAAFHDPRFQPLAQKELKDVEIEISVLTTPLPINSYQEIELGRDGIVVAYGPKLGLFLPDVAAETGWDQETFFRECAMQKAGLREDELAKAILYTFQTQAFREKV